ncbi:MAG TPA: type II toxin-antitoxin system Phd/YefM family antitoxin [Xanthobacteraceae bacterium]
MKLAAAVKSISQLKASAPQVIREVSQQRKPVVITVNGEAKAILQDIASFDETQEAMALLRILALANRAVESGKVRPAREAFVRIRRRARARS